MIRCNSPDSTIFIRAWLNKSLKKKRKNRRCVVAFSITGWKTSFKYMYANFCPNLSSFLLFNCYANTFRCCLRYYSFTWSIIKYRCHLKGEPLGRAKALSR